MMRWASKLPIIKVFNVRTGLNLWKVLLRRKFMISMCAIICVIIMAATPSDWGALDLTNHLLSRRDAQFEGPNGRPWKRLLHRCPEGASCIHLATLRFNSMSNWESVLGQHLHPSCSRDCQLVSDPGEAHALIFHLIDMPSKRRLRRLHATRPPGQVWILFSQEAPVNYVNSQCYHTCDYPFPVPLILSSLKELFLPSYLIRHYPDTTVEAGFFNWTMTYRRDSTFYFPYDNFEKIPNGFLRPTVSPDQLVAKKKFLMFAVVSNCIPYNRRQDVIRELQSVMELHVYGRCGSRSLPSGQDKITALSEQYYFYLSIENSFCKDYITEKFFSSGLMSESVPVAFGGMSKSEYDAVAPPQSYIYGGDFPTASLLAKHLRWLASNPSEYAKYKRWRATHQSVNRNLNLETNSFCSICQKLTKSRRLSRFGATTKLDLNRFYNTKAECRDTAYWPFQSPGS